jgi:hypothetical protein
LADRWTTAALDRNFIDMQMSSVTELNISGDCNKEQTNLKKLNFLEKRIQMEFTKCMAELRGGWGSINSCDGVCPKLRIWFSMA